MIHIRLSVYSALIALLPMVVTSHVLAASNYRVGVDYHALGSDFGGTSFIAQYQKPEIKARVKTQLQAMADNGVKVINTRLWLVDPEGGRFPTIYSRLGFPPSNQEILNLRDYVKDVGTIQTPDGSYLDLYITVLGNGCAGYNGEFCNYTWDQTVSKYKLAFTQIIGAVADATHPNGSKVVSRMYFTGEAMIGAKQGEDKFFIDVYPFFLSETRNHGITPTLYFLLLGDENDILNDSFTDADYPAINKHKSLYWIYRTTEFMKKHNLYIPEQIDFSFYADPKKSTADTLVKRVFDDLAAVYPGKTFGVAETYYHPDVAKRRSIGQAFASEATRRGLLKETFFWTTPDAGGVGIHVGFPLDISAYYANMAPPIPCAPVYYFNTQTHTCTATSSPYTKSLFFCTDTSISCADNLKTYLLGKTTGVCYPTLSACQRQYPGVTPTRGVTAPVSSSSPIPAPSGTHRPTDLNADGRIDIFDYNILVSNFGKTGSFEADIDKNGTVDIFDYNTFVGNFGK
jgi:hypothetical protein